MISKIILAILLSVLGLWLAALIMSRSKSLIDKLSIPLTMMYGYVVGLICATVVLQLYELLR